MSGEYIRSRYSSMISLEALLKEGTTVLEENKIQEARLDAWLLLEYVTGISRALYYADPGKMLEKEKADEYRQLIRQRAEHIRGKRENTSIKSRCSATYRISAHCSGTPPQAKATTS